MKKLFYGMCAAALLYEFIALENESDGDTISEIVWTATHERPLVPFVLGMVAGHFFWQAAKSAARATAGKPL